MTSAMATPEPAVASALVIGGQDLERLAARVGTTPFFAYDRRHITRRVEQLRTVMPPALSLSYAIKANPMPAVVQHVASIVDGLDVASAHEMNVALDTGLPATRISFAGPGKTSDEVRRAVAAGVTIELESPTEAARVVAAADQLGVTPTVAVRVNPDFAVRGSGMRMGGGPQQFGIDAECVPRFLQHLDRTGLDVAGFHVFAGSQNLNASILCEAQRKTVELLLELATHCARPVRSLNLGGGFGIPYFPKDQPLDLRPIGEHLHELIERRITPVLPDATVQIELGRYLVGEAGVYVTRVVDRKVSRGTTFLVVDGGLHHQLAASGNFGQVIRRNYPVTVAPAAPGPADDTVTIVGCLCTPLDVLADQVVVPRADVGDLVVVHQAGAYGLTASPTAFLGHPAPPEVLV